MTTGRILALPQHDEPPPPDGFEDFVVARYGRLLRTAYLLTNDHALSEDLVQTTLTKTWFAWSRIVDDPEPYVRKVMLNTYSTWWRRKWNGERATADLPDHGSRGPDDLGGTSSRPAPPRPTGRRRTRCRCCAAGSTAPSVAG